MRFIIHWDELGNPIIMPNNHNAFIYCYKLLMAEKVDPGNAVRRHDGIFRQHFDD